MSLGPRKGPSPGVAAPSGELNVGIVLIDGVGLRVALQIGSNLLHMSPAAARRKAKDFDTPLAVAAGIADIGEALREFADEVEAMGATKQ